MKIQTKKIVERQKENLLTRITTDNNNREDKKKVMKTQPTKTDEGEEKREEGRAHTHARK